MGTWLGRIGFAGAALYILLSPALPQLAGWGAPWVRPWTMYSGVGEGLAKGTFTARYADGREQTFTTLEVLGQPRYPNAFHYEFDQLVFDEASLRQLVADFCERSDALTRLSFEGRIGARDGWVDYQGDHLCAPPVQIAGTAP